MLYIRLPLNKELNLPKSTYMYITIFPDLSYGLYARRRCLWKIIYGGNTAKNYPSYLKHCGSKSYMRNITMNTHILILARCNMYVSFENSSHFRSDTNIHYKSLYFDLINLQRITRDTVSRLNETSISCIIHIKSSNLFYS